MTCRRLSEGEEYVEAITQAVAQKEDASVIDLPPLVRTINTDALQAILGRSDPEPITIEFTYCGHDVIVGNEGYVEITDEK